jgi:hypothetical protein
MADNSSSLGFWGGLMLVLIGMWLWDSADDIIHSKFRYSIQYTTDEANVFNSPKPHDCAFWGAPIGKKWCHYDRTVEDHQVPALITGNDTNTHRPTWSDDNGKTWHWNDGLDGAAVFTPYPAETHVYVGWSKVEEE